MKVERGFVADELGDTEPAFATCPGGSTEYSRAPIVNPSGSANILAMFEQFAHALPHQIALLDEQWNILAVNCAWTRRTAGDGYAMLRPGANYFEFASGMAAKGHSPAQPVVDGILGMMEGNQSSFCYLHQGTGRWLGHTFQLSINRVSVSGKAFATVTRYDVTELMRLRRARETYSQSVIEAQAEERRRLAREVHDSTIQFLVGLGFNIGQLKKRPSSDRLHDIAGEMEQLLAEAQREIRALSFLAHPPLLREKGLVGALHALTKGYERRTGLKTLLHMSENLVVGWHAAEVAIYRFVQESLANVHRHARASEASIALLTGRSMFHAIVADNGVGMPADIQRGVGLSGMRSRVAELGGRLLIRPSFPGTTLIASLPRRPRLGATGDLALNRIA